MVHPNISARELRIGTGSVVHETARICGADGGPADAIEIGDHCYIGEGVQIRVPRFSLGDYAKIHHYTSVHGYLPCSIGHNAWIGQFCIIDSIGGTTIGDNCGIGAHSQLWSHIKFGDTLEGCRFLSEKPLVVGKDVWFVGHCIVSPIVAHDRAMAMVGSVVTRDMAENTIYAGVPAVEVSSKIGPQFAPRPIEEKIAQLRRYIVESAVDADAIRVVQSAQAVQDDGRTYFIMEDRTYTKNGTRAEVAFMKFLLPARAKFTPRGH